MLGREIFPLSPSSNSTITPTCFPSSDEPPESQTATFPSVMQLLNGFKRLVHTIRYVGAYNTECSPPTSADVAWV